jgi:hypothetical protein
MVSVGGANMADVVFWAAVGVVSVLIVVVLAVTYRGI